MKIGFISFDHLRNWHGITRQVDRLAAAMSDRGHRIVIAALEGNASAKIPVSTRPYPHELITLNLSGKRGEAREKIAASGMDVCFASMGGSQILHMPGLLRGSGIPFVFGDPYDPRARSFAIWQPYESFGALACADTVQTLLPEYIPFYPEALRARVTDVGIPAPPPAEIDFAARRNRKTRVIIGVGRFNEMEKRFSLLLRAFALLHNDFPDWRLKLVGDGPYWAFYHEMAAQLGIKSRTDFTGSVADPEPHYAQADIFCMPSLIEGFGLVVGEAAACALPLAGFRFCVPAASLIEPGTGALAGDTTHEALAETLRSLMALSPEERERMGARSREAHMRRYGGEVIFDRWEESVKQTIENAGANGGTALDRIWRNRMLRYIGPEWDGLEPDSPVWTEKLLEAAAGEITARGDPMTPCEQPDADAENVRLRCELARLREDYGRLEKKYTQLLAQYQTPQGRRKR
ncbi:MAG: glycosyltransferase [Oscillospiraceae bacterium]|nr:glycosyltransferase [Oscillospiraceae bacterium]